MANQIHLKVANQPRHFKFPKREFGTSTIAKRSFQSSWFDKWTWLHYNEQRDLAFCYLCQQAVKENKLQWASNSDDAFIQRGFSNWKAAVDKFSQHEKSKCHKESILKIITAPSTMEDVAESLSKQVELDKSENRHCFLKILSSMRFLARQGIGIRGHDDECNSNFSQLLKLRGEDDYRIIAWMKKKSNKYTSADIQNEILRIMAHNILRQITDCLHSVQFYSLMVDETTDISNAEQAVICMRWVDDKLSANEEFIGLYQIESTDSNSIVAMIRDVILRLNLTLAKLRGQCYDGAASMSGIRNGVSTQILKEEPRAVYTHCYGHSLNLACNDTIKQSKVIKDALEVTQEIAKLVKRSPKRDSLLHRIKDQLADNTPGVRVLCPTRWTVRGHALYCIRINYRALQLLWDESLCHCKDIDIKNRIRGVSSYMENFNFLYGILIGELLLSHSENLSKILQSADISAAEAQQIVQMTLKTLKDMKTEDKFRSFWLSAIKTAEELGVGEPTLPRKRKAPQRFESDNPASNLPTTIDEYYCGIYFQSLDRIITCIQERFDQPGYRVYTNLQDLLLKCVNGSAYEEEFDFVTNFYGTDICPQKLKTQLEILKANHNGKSKNSLSSLLQTLRSYSEPQRMLMSEVFIIAKLIVVMPATNAVSERSFSTLRLIKSYLRSTMTEMRLNSAMILNIHKERIDDLSLIEVANEFVVNSDHRQSIFGKFVMNDLN